MNEFVVAKDRRMTPQQIVRGVMGISLEQLINAIRENRDGQFDCLFVSEGQSDKQPISSERRQGNAAQV